MRGDAPPPSGGVAGVAFAYGAVVNMFSGAEGQVVEVARFSR